MGPQGKSRRDGNLEGILAGGEGRGPWLPSRQWSLHAKDPGGRRVCIPRGGGRAPASGTRGPRWLRDRNAVPGVGDPADSHRVLLCQSWSRGAPVGGISPCLGTRGAAAAESPAQRSAGYTSTPPRLLPNDDATQGSATTRTRPSGEGAPRSPHCASGSPPIRRAFRWNVREALVTAQ